MTRQTNARIAGVTFLLYIIIGITMMMIAGVTAADDVTQRLSLIVEIPLGFWLMIKGVKEKTDS